MDRQECLSYYGFVGEGERGLRILDRFFTHEMIAVMATS